MALAERSQHADYAAINEGLDHALTLLLKANDFPLKIELNGKSPYACFKQIHELSEQRLQRLDRHQAKSKSLKAKAKPTKHEEEEEDEDDGDIPMRIAIPVKSEPAKRKGKEKGSGKLKAEPVPHVKKLDLSGVNLSPVITQPKPQPVVSALTLPPLSSRSATMIPIRLATVEVNRPLVLHSASAAPLTPAAEMLQKLQRLPMLENLVADSGKHKTLVKWIESHDGKDKDISKPLLTTVNRLQKNGHGVVSGNGKNSSNMSPRRLLSLSNETLDDRLKLEGHVERKRKIRVKRGDGAVKSEKGRLKKLTTGGDAEPRSAGRKRPLNEFVVESDEEEYEHDGAWGGGDDSEAEYESEGEESSEEEEEEEEMEMRLSNFDAAVEGKRSSDAEKAGSSVNGSGSKRSPSASTKTSPRAAVASSSSSQAQESAALVGATAQLAQVVARIRADEEEEAATAAAAAGVESTPTYLSYDKQPPAVHVSVMKQEPKKVVTPKDASAKRLSVVDGTSESNAIVLDDSDEDDDEDDDDGDDVVPEQRVAPPPPAKKEPKPKLQVKTPPKTPPKTLQKPAKPRTKQVIRASTPKSTTKTNVGKAPTKQKAKVSDDEDEGEAEFVGMDDDGSSTDVDNDVFDLNEEDVYVVESILQIKRGRTSLTNSGRTTKEADLFLVKWEGYDELTWEPDANIPKRLIHFFIERESAKRECNYQIKEYLERRVVRNVTTGKEEIIYRIKWENVENAYWEVKTNLPDKTVVWLEKTNRSSGGKVSANGGGGLSGPSRKKVKK